MTYVHTLFVSGIRGALKCSAPRVALAFKMGCNESCQMTAVARLQLACVCMCVGACMGCWVVSVLNCPYTGYRRKLS